MGHRTVILSLSFSMAMASAAEAQVDNCDALLQYGIFNHVATVRSMSAAESMHSDMCSESASNMSDSRATSLGASYGLFSASGSDARRKIQAYQSRYCSNNSQSRSGADLNQEERSFVSADLATAFNSCKQLVQRGVTIEPTVNFSKFATFAIRQTFGGTVALQGVWSVPENAWKCQGQDPTGKVISVDRGTSLPLSASLLTITCERAGSEVALGGKQIREAPASTLEIHTQASNLIVPFGQTTAQNELNELRDAIARSIPAGMVAAFAGSCPSGWQEFSASAGRVLLSQNPQHPVGQTGGAETTTLSVENLPSHQHQTLEAGDPNSSKFGYGPTPVARHGVSWANNYPTASKTANTGGNQAFSNMPPFISVRYCQKQ